jgi:hypothetical protein
MATWPAGIVIADSRIAAGEPLTEDLMTDYRDRDDYLNDLYFGALGQIAHFKGTALDQAVPYDITIDDTRDYRDRFLWVHGMIWGGNNASVAAMQPGGANDDSIHDQILSHGTPHANINAEVVVDGWMYTEDGGASRVTEPYLTFTQGNMNAANLWVNAAGDLMLGIDMVNNPNFRASGYELSIIFSEDQGGV